MVLTFIVSCSGVTVTMFTVGDDNNAPQVESQFHLLWNLKTKLFINNPLTKSPGERRIVKTRNV